MATFDNRKIIDDIVAGNGYYEDDPRVALIVEYTNAFGNQTWGVTWSNEVPTRQERYLIETKFVRVPRVFWRAGIGTAP